MKERCTEMCVACFVNRLHVITHDKDCKMQLYSHIKDNYAHEKYFDVKCTELIDFTRFRLSLHCLPIERGRYSKPKTPRTLRVCQFCTKHLGNEYHALMECKHETLDKNKERIYK